MSGGNDLNRSFPVIDFTSLDAEAILSDLTAYAKSEFSDTWTDFNQGQLGWVFTKILAYQFDVGTFYLNALMGETVLHGALLRQSKIDIAARLDYQPPSASAATVIERMTVNPLGPFPFTISRLTTRVSNGGTPDEVTFMPVADVTVSAAPGPGYVDVAMVEGDLISSEPLGNSTGAANQRFVLAQTPMIDGTLEVYVNGVLWALASHAVDQRSTDESYLVSRDDAEQVTVIFGDSVNGKIPPITQPITATYKIGGGRRGNLSSGTIKTAVSVPVQVTAVTNPDASSAGGNRPSNAAIARAAPAALHAHSGLITDLDIRDAAITVPGVAKAVAFPGEALSRTIRLVIAPAGGGQPTSVLRNSVQIALRTDKMIGMRFSVEGPVYKDLELTLVVYAKAGAKRRDVANVATALLTDLATGAGAYDFDQLDFGGIDPETGEPFFGESAIQRLFAATGTLIDRVSIERMTVKGAGRAVQANTGNGTVSSVVVTTNDNRRREYLLMFSSASTFAVKERIVGVVSRVEPSAIEDDSKDFLFDSYGPDLITRGYTTLNPNRNQTLTYPVTLNTTSRVESSAVNLNLIAAPGDEYYIERTLASGTVGVPYVVQDPVTLATILTWTVTAGSAPFTSSDRLVVDTYPPRGDVTLRSDEYPQIAGGDITIRIVGGVST